MELQDFLRGRGLKDLKKQYGIKVTRSQENPDIVCFKYSKTKSPFERLIVRQCRGIILDEEKNWEVVSYPYDKFFNYGATGVAEIDWSSAKVYEKLDGSLMVLYFYNGSWRVQTSSSPDAASEVGDSGFSFKKLFWEAWERLEYELPDDSDHCFMFEFLTPHKSTIVRQKEEGIVLHGVRNIETLQEEGPESWAEKYHWQVIKFHPLNSWDEVVGAAKALDPMDNEGYVVRDANFRRVKVKSPQYMALARLRRGFFTRPIFRLLQLSHLTKHRNFCGFFLNYLIYFRKFRQKTVLLFKLKLLKPAKY